MDLKTYTVALCNYPEENIQQVVVSAVSDLDALKKGLSEIEGAGSWFMDANNIDKIKSTAYIGDCAIGVIEHQQTAFQKRQSKEDGLGMLVDKRPKENKYAVSVFDKETLSHDVSIVESHDSLGAVMRGVQKHLTTEQVVDMCDGYQNIDLLLDFLFDLALSVEVKKINI